MDNNDVITNAFNTGQILGSNLVTAKEQFAQTLLLSTKPTHATGQ